MMTIMCTWGVCFWRHTLKPELWPFIYFSIIRLPYVSHNLVSRITENIWEPQSQNVTARLDIMCSGASCVFLKTYLTDFFIFYPIKLLVCFTHSGKVPWANPYWKQLNGSQLRATVRSFPGRAIDSCHRGRPLR